MARVRAVVLAALILAASALTCYWGLAAARELDRRYLATRFAVETGQCPLSQYTYQIWPDCSRRWAATYWQ